MGTLLLAALFLGTACAGPQQAQAATGFPRITVWWPDSDEQPLAQRAKCDWTALRNGDADHIAELRAANPSITVLGYTDARELMYDLSTYNDPMNVVFRSASTDWILTQAGSNLTGAVNNSATSIPVGDTSRFAAGEMVLVDRELMYVNSVGGSSLNVTRGRVTPAASHSSGARVAAVICTWPNTVTFDLSTNCRKADVGYGAETWASWNVRRSHATMDSADWDGLFVDCLECNPHWMVQPGRNRSIDANRDNVPDDMTAYDAAWNTGAEAFGDALKTACGSASILLGNGNMRNYTLNGNVFEEFPYRSLSLASWNKVFIGPWAYPWASYPEWATNAASPNMTLVQTYGAQTDYQWMRYGLASTLLSNGTFSYALSSKVHAVGGIWWYDEYDNAGKGRGYLGQPTGTAYSVGSNVWRRDYQNGIVLANPDTASHTVNLGGTFRKIKGTQAPSVNDGSLVNAVTLKGQDGIVLLRESTGGGGTPPPAAAHIPLYRFYNVHTGTHFYTANASERDSIIANLGSVYRYEGVAYFVSQIGADVVPVYRFYNTRTGTHFYTASASEKDSVSASLGHIYAYEGVAFHASTSSSGTIPIHRFYNNATGTHFYTASQSERDAVIANLGYLYTYEGPVYHAWSN